MSQESGIVATEDTEKNRVVTVTDDGGEEHAYLFPRRTRLLVENGQKIEKGAQLNETDTRRVLQHLADLWSYDVALTEVDGADKVLKEYVVSPRAAAVAA